MLPIDLNGHVAVVTGATGELGRVIARTLAEAGASVALHYRRNADAADRLQREIEGRGGRACTAQADVGDLEQMLAMRDRVAEALGPADIVVTNAVEQIHPWKPVLEEAPEDYESQFRSCVMQNVYAAKAFVPAMIERRWGRFIGINTECTMQLHPNQSAYTAGKGGMDRVLRVLAKEVGEHQITVNQVAPGWMISDKHRGGGEQQPDYEKNVPLKRRGEDRDIANAVAFFASDLAAYITGVYLPVCGGNVMPRI